MNPFHNILQFDFSNIKKLQTSVAGSFLPENCKMMIWKINSDCNLNCNYCHDDKPSANKTFTPVQIEKAFDKNDITWFVNITGGEPFLYPEFIKIIRVLTKNHFVSINTNLTKDNYSQLFSIEGKDHILGINASLHIDQLESKNLLQTYIQNFNLLKNSGIPILASIVAHPMILENIVAQIHQLNEQGIKPVVLRFFYGSYQNKIYPESYTPAEINLISEFILPPTEFAISNHNRTFFNTRCQTGFSSCFMKPDGELFRCTSDAYSLGNFISGQAVFKKNLHKCNILRTQCLFECMFHSEIKQENYFNMLRKYIFKKT